MEQITNRQSEYTAPFIDTRIASDVSEEFTLADYYPEIKKVLSFTARAIPEGKFISGNEIDCDGIVSFSVTYLGEDSTIASVSFPIRYTQSAQLPENAAASDEIVCDTRADGATCRVTAPRKLALKAHLTTRITSTRICDASVDIQNEKGVPASAAEAITVEQKCTQTPTVRLYYGAATGSLSDEITQRSCDRAVSADGIINILEARCEEGKVAVRAEAIVTLLCQDQSGMYLTSRETVPFEVDVSVNEAEAGDRAVASAIVTSIEITSGDDGLYFELDYDMDVQVVKTVNVTICEDAYSTEFENTVEASAEKIVAPVKFANAHMTQTGEIKRRGESADGEYVIRTSADASINDIAFDDGKLTANGTLNVQSSIAKEGEVSVEDGKIPFSFVTDAEECKAPFYRADVQVTDCSARIEDGALKVTAQLAITLSAFDVRQVNAVKKVVLKTEKTLEKTPGVRIVFPDAGEDVWSLCKRCAASRRTLEKLNDLPEGVTELNGEPVIVE